MRKFLYDLYIFFFGGPLKLPDFIMVDRRVGKSERPVSRLVDNLNKFSLLVRIRSMQVGYIDWKRVDLPIRHDNANIFIKSLK